MTSTGNDEQEIPPISPLLEPTYDDHYESEPRIKSESSTTGIERTSWPKLKNSTLHLTQIIPLLLLLSNDPHLLIPIRRIGKNGCTQCFIFRPEETSLQVSSTRHLPHPLAILCWTGIVFIFSNHRSLFPGSLKESKSTLDEFSNHYGQGSLRRKELLGSCLQLGIREDRCDVLDISQIQDDPITWWPVDKIGKLVNEHIDKWMIDSIVTFDDYGVSGHINHRAVSASVTELAISSYKKSMSTSKTITPRLFDLPLTFLGLYPRLSWTFSTNYSALESLTYDPKTEQSTSESEKQRRSISTDFEKGLLINGWAGIGPLGTLLESQSQMVWDRHLYMILSQFMYFNTIERIV
ncbi:hypothetical protein H4Q26_002848 [Puccinia striiformis f. sp. tritici PST-130]|nr:hypothetical protein H4Q26_002848 [Puccinia striiformis f. sp. tritici PST-130]